jgi:CubicO group peptidase (beta-lactamase class C family)
MKLYEQNKINLITKLSKYMPELKHTDKKNIRINQILAHHSGLRPWIPFYKNTLDKNENLRSDLYKTTPNTDFSIPVTGNIFLRNDYIDTIFQAIIDTPRYRKKKYRYSDLGFYLMSELIRKKTGETIDKFATGNFYAPLGMNYTTYNPWKNNTIATIPSENDKVFRKQIINGYVNDPGAAMLGGVSGHAGVFSNVNDLAKLGQLFLNKGTYGNKKYFDAKTLDIFNNQYFAKKDNRRALGFDKPMFNTEDPGPTCISAPQQSFGHMGFTGTYFWIDPVNQSIYIFLSNRTFPDAENKKLAKHDIRTKIQQAFYDVFKH